MATGAALSAITLIVLGVLAHQQAGAMANLGSFAPTAFWIGGGGMLLTAYVISKCGNQVHAHEIAEMMMRGDVLNLVEPNEVAFYREPTQTKIQYVYRTAVGMIGDGECDESEIDQTAKDLRSKGHIKEVVSKHTLRVRFRGSDTF